MTEWLKPDKAERLRTRLDEIPDLYALVETLHTTRLPRAGSGGSRPHPGSRPPISLALVHATDRQTKTPARDWRNPWLAANRVEKPDDPRRVHNENLLPPQESQLRRELDEDLRRGVLPQLESWVRMAESEMLDEGEEHTPLAEQPTVSSEAGWLHQHMGWMLDQQWVTELEQDVSKIWRDLRQLCRERAPYRPTCPDCGEWLTSLTGYWSCPGCGRDYRDDRMVMSCQHPMTGERIAHLFGLSYATIRSWHHRGHLEPAMDGAGKPLMDGRKPRFHVNDVLRLADSSGLTSDGLGS